MTDRKLTRSFPLLRRALLLNGAATAALAALAGVSLSAGSAPYSAEQNPRAEIGFIKINSGIKLRRIIVHNLRPKGVVLFLHGFPETLYAWKNIALHLARDYQVRHYPHLQSPKQAIEEVRASFGDAQFRIRYIPDAQASVVRSSSQPCLALVLGCAARS